MFETQIPEQRVATEPSGYLVLNAADEIVDRAESHLEAMNVVGWLTRTDRAAAPFRCVPVA